MQSINDTNIENHPLKPFLPKGAKLLMLGSFPPKHERWSMEFFYPNFQNDMWRIMGLLFYDNKNHFVTGHSRAFQMNDIVDFCTTKGLAIYDTAISVRRLKDNASDKFLEVIQATDISALLNELPACQAIATTGQKATDVICQTLGCIAPRVGEHVEVNFEGRNLIFFRMPSSSRAYPMPLDNKAAIYSLMFTQLNML